MFRRVTKRLLRSTDYLFPRSSDLVAFGERMYPREEHPAMWVDLPDDLRRGWLWDGQLPDGREAANLCFQYIKEPDLIALGEKAGRQALKLTAFLAAGVSILAFPQFLPVIDALPAFPSWALDSSAYGALGAWALQTAAMLVWSTATVVISNGWPLLLLLPVFAWFAFLEGMKTLWNSVSFNMRRPTMDALVAEHNGTRRDIQYDAYSSLAVDVTSDRLKDYPVIKIGRSTGMMAAAGVASAPAKGSWLSVDGHSVMRHIIAFGDTGTGKTRLFLQPLFKNLIVDAVWPKGHKAGAYVTDGKGVLWRDLLPICGPRMADVRIIGVGEGHYGVDLVKGMSPPEVAEAIRGVGTQLGGGADSSKDQFWVKKGANIVKHTAWIALALESDPELLASFIAAEECRPYSLMGINLLATREDMADKAIEVVKKLSNLNDDEAEPEKGRLLRKAVKSGTWIKLEYHQVAEATKSGFKSNVEDLFSVIDDDDALSERFCTGIFDEAQTVEIDHCLKGGITMLAIGAGAKAGDFGQFIAVWLKTRLMQTARTRNEEDSRIAEKFSCAMFADEYQDLATKGTPNSCGKFWNKGRSSGLYLVAATQSMAAVEDAVGTTAARNILSNMSTRVLLKTKEKGTLDYYRELLGQSMQVISTLKGVYSNHAAITRRFGLPNAVISFGAKAGLLPTRFAAPTETLPIYDIAHLVALNETLPEEKREHPSIIEKRQEDMIQRAISESSQLKDKVKIDDLTTGDGYALVIAERGGSTRYDFVDLKPILQAA
ncbi:type IV secretion system DNA-binding domain-containing protein [Rhizobium leguminosarum]|uniref:TraM recognition domain-containing protein n=1 Tax=Rhizobium leguminosarum TaxID=384 RepID=UPI001C9517B5|nr:TraM recognition domain-containing protein [Rhizobium leguminosarum]MBY5551093.1 type IV secretion system DNA-binding domain-containing protein [Rhizobium leguminosarum]